MIYLRYRPASKMNSTQRWVYNVFLMKTIGGFIDNAVYTRFVYDAIMHIFACKNDWDLCIALKTLYNWHLHSWGCSEYTNASNEPKKVWRFEKISNIANHVYVYPLHQVTDSHCTESQVTIQSQTLYTSTPTLCCWLSLLPARMKKIQLKMKGLEWPQENMLIFLALKGR